MPSYFANPWNKIQPNWTVHIGKSYQHTSHHRYNCCICHSNQPLHHGRIWADAHSARNSTASTRVVTRLHSPPATLTPPLERSKPQADTSADIIAELLLDIEEEDNLEPGHRFRNRFLHRFLDTYNAKMGDFGNYLSQRNRRWRKKLLLLKQP